MVSDTKKEKYHPLRRIVKGDMLQLQKISAIKSSYSFFVTPEPGGVGMKQIKFYPFHDAHIAGIIFLCSRVHQLW